MSITRASLAAVDIGASSGRVVHVSMSRQAFTIDEVARFPNGPTARGSSLHWDFGQLTRQVAEGIAVAAAHGAPIDSIGIDTWGVDYGLLSPEGVLVDDPFHYRDPRTEGCPDRVSALVSPEDLYARTGTAPLPLQTIYQLMADHDGPRLDRAARALLMPDLLNHWLTGLECCEVTNASTTGLMDPTSRSFDRQLLADLGIAPGLLLEVTEPGATLGPLRPDLAVALGLGAATVVTSIASHDTASAVVAVPLVGDRSAFVACGTWSILGLEIGAPILTGESRGAGFSNELGADGTVRYVRNVAGLWLLQECLRAWNAAGEIVSLPELIDLAARAVPLRTVINPDSPTFVQPGDMPARIAAEARRRGEPVPSTPGEVVRCILDSLALAFRRHLRTAMSLAARQVDVLHMVGGGSHNRLLCQLTADACRCTVVAGPAEASAMGNALLQGRNLVMPGASLGELRQLLRGQVALERYEPDGSDGPWSAAEGRGG